MKKTYLPKLIIDLEDTQSSLNRAIGNLGHSVGGIDKWIGSLSDYKKLVRAKLIIDTVLKKANDVNRKRNERTTT